MQCFSRKARFFQLLLALPGAFLLPGFFVSSIIVISGCGSAPNKYTSYHCPAYGIGKHYKTNAASRICEQYDQAYTSGYEAGVASGESLRSSKGGSVWNQGYADGYNDGVKDYNDARELQHPIDEPGGKIRRAAGFECPTLKQLNEVGRLNTKEKYREAEALAKSYQCRYTLERTIDRHGRVKGNWEYF